MTTTKSSDKSLKLPIPKTPNVSKHELIEALLRSVEQRHVDDARNALRMLLMVDALEAQIPKDRLEALSSIALSLAVQEEPKFLTTGDAAKKLGVSDQTIVNWIEAGKLRAEKTLGGHYRVYADQFKTTDEQDQAFDEFFDRMHKRFEHLPPVDEDDLGDL